MFDVNKSNGEVLDSVAYIRDKHGATRDVTIKDGVEHFLSDDGYRLTIYVDEQNYIVLRREEMSDIKLLTELDDQLGHRSVATHTTVVGFK